jgi:hypothetical protein
MGDTIVVMGGNSADDIGVTTVTSARPVNPKTAEYLVLGEDTWKNLPSMHHERVGATACLLP